MTTIECPRTGAALDFELPGDETTLADYWQGHLKIHCPVCDRVHKVPFRRAYVAGVMSELRCVPVDIQQAIEQ
jgi:hypothetical protein